MGPNPLGKTCEMCRLTFSIQVFALLGLILEITKQKVSFGADLPYLCGVT